MISDFDASMGSGAIAHKACARRALRPFTLIISVIAAVALILRTLW